jgi:hypothetical protein
MKMQTLVALLGCVFLSAFAEETNTTLGYVPIITNKVTITVPSDLLANGANGATPYSLSFVFNQTADFRTMYCDEHVLQQRVSHGTCVIDTEIVDNHKEVKISLTGTSLRDVLKGSGIRRLQKLTGRSHGQIRIINKDAILSSAGDSFLETKIFPGDFIIILPTY